MMYAYLSVGAFGAGVALLLLGMASWNWRLFGRTILMIFSAVLLACFLAPALFDLDPQSENAWKIWITVMNAAHYIRGISLGVVSLLCFVAAYAAWDTKETVSLAPWHRHHAPTNSGATPSPTVPGAAGDH